MKKKWILCVLTAVLAAGLGAFLWYESQFTTVLGQKYRKTTEQIDLSGVSASDFSELSGLSSLRKADLRDTGLTAAQFEALSEALPQCEILWDVPFQGGTEDSSSKVLTVTHLSEEDLAALPCFPHLEQLDVSRCRDYDAILAAQAAFPRICGSYQVELEGTLYPQDTASLTLSSADTEALRRVLPYFPQLKQLSFSEIQPDPVPLLELNREFPQIRMDFDFTLWGVTVNSLSREFDLSNREIPDLELLETIASGMPELEKVIMCDCGLTDPEMAELNSRHPDVLFVWNVYLMPGFPQRSDIKSLLPTNLEVWIVKENIGKLQYFTELEALDLGHHKVPHCEFVAHMPKLKYLLLGDTKVSDLTPLTGLKNLIYLELFILDIDDFSPLLSCPKLEYLNLSYCHTDDIETIGKLKQVTYLRWAHNEWNRPKADDIAYLQKQLPNTLLELPEKESSTGGAWRTTQHYRDMRDAFGTFYMEG